MKDDRTRKEQGARLRLAREQAGFRSARQAALDNGWPESSYRAHEAGGRTIGQDDAERYAARFRLLGAKVSAKSILFGDDVIDGPEQSAKSRRGQLAVLQTNRGGKGRTLPLREPDDVSERVEAMWGASDDLKDVLRLLYTLDGAEAGVARNILFAAFPAKVAFLAGRNGKGSNSGQGSGARTT